MISQVSQIVRTEAHPLRALRPREPMMTSVGLSPSIYVIVNLMKTVCAKGSMTYSFSDHIFRTLAVNDFDGDPYLKLRLS